MENKPLHPKKTIKFLLLFFLALLVLSALTIYWMLVRAVPKTSGEMSLKGLKAQVTVIRDEFGIPHIEAQNNEDAYRTLGYIMASERLFQMEMQRRMGNGELAEVFGKSQLMSDILFRTLGLKREAEQIIDQGKRQGLFHPEMLKEANAFYDGINQFIAQGPMPLELILAGIKPRPFSLVDGQTFIGVMAYSFGMGTLQDPLFTELGRRLDQARLLELRSGSLEKTKNESRYVLHRLPFHSRDMLESLTSGFPLFDGSNGWVLASHRSESGYPILANDPHISYTQPGVWFEAHLKTPEFETYGHFLSIVPFAVHAHNRERGWGFTMSLTDDLDLYQEKINWPNRTYTFKGKEYPLKGRSEKIAVRFSEDRHIEVTETNHGPILNNGLIGNDLALKWAYLDRSRPSADLISVLHKIGLSRSMEEFKSAVKEGRAPGLNILYADKKNIAWWMFGDIILRPPHVKSDFILDGASGNDEYLGYLDFHQKPFKENPKDGLIVSANSRPETYPAQERGDFQPDYRYATLKHILSQKEKWTIEDLQTIQTLSVNFENKLIREKMFEYLDHDPILQDVRYKDLFSELLNWDLQSEVSSRPALLFYTWAIQISRSLLRPLTDEEFHTYSRIPSGSFFLKKVLTNPDSAWWRGIDRKKFMRLTFLQTIKQLEDRLGSDQKTWAWGALHQLKLMHPFGTLPLIGDLFNIGPFPVSGSIQEINNQRMSGMSLKVVAGPSTRRLIDFARPEKALGVLPSGNSAHLLSPYYKNHLEMFKSGQFRPESLDAEDYRQSGLVLTFIPEK